MTEHSLPDSRAPNLRHRPLPAAPVSRPDGAPGNRANQALPIMPRPAAKKPAHNEWDEWKSVRDVY